MSIDKKILSEGLKLLLWALPAVFIGPAVIHFAFINQKQPLFPVLLGIGILTAFTGIFLIFKGILTLLRSMKDE